MNRRHIILAAALVLASPVMAAGEQPIDIVTKIYKISAGKKGDYAGDSAFLDKAIRRDYFTKNFVTALNKMDKKSAETNEPILDFDPVTSSQDPSVKSLKIETEAATDSKTTIVARFFAYDNKKPTLVHYLFVQEGGGWKLDDITGDVEGDPWSVRELIK